MTLRDEGKRVSLYLLDELYDQIAKSAQDNKRSINQEVTAILEGHFGRVKERQNWYRIVSIEQISEAETKKLLDAD